MAFAPLQMRQPAAGEPLFIMLSDLAMTKKIRSDSSRDRRTEQLEFPLELLQDKYKSGRRPIHDEAYSRNACGIS